MAIKATSVFPKSSRTPEQKVQSAQGGSGKISTRDYASVTRSISHINNNLLGIKQLIEADAKGDQAAAIQADTNAKKQQDNLKKNKTENFIEAGIQNSIIKPVKATAKKAQGAFSKFFETLGLVFLGWLADKGGKMLEAWKDGDMSTFNKLKNEVIKGTLIAGGVLLALNGGIGLIVSGIGALIGGLITAIPATLALLMNPVVLLGIAAVLAWKMKDWQAKSGPDKEIYEMVSKAGGDRTEAIKTMKTRIAELEAKKNEKGFNILDEMKVNSEIREWTQQLRALEQGYWGTGDPRYRKAGYENKTPVPGFMKEDKKWHIMKGDENLMNTAKELRKSGGETPQDIAALVRIQGLYRDISGIKNEQNKLREKLNNPNTPASEKVTIQERIKEQEIKFDAVYKELTTLKEGLSPEHQRIIDSVAKNVSLQKNKDGSFSSKYHPGEDGKLGTADDEMRDPAVYEQLARILEKVYPSTNVMDGAKYMPQGTEAILGNTTVTPTSGTPGTTQKGMKTVTTKDKNLNSAITSNNSDKSSIETSSDTSKTTFEIVPIDTDTNDVDPEDDTDIIGNAENRNLPALVTRNSSNSYLVHFENTYLT